MKRQFGGALIMFALMTAFGDASAQEARQESSEQDLFSRGKALFAEGKYPEAYEAYRKAWQRSPSYDVAGNLGNVEMKLGRWADAVEHLTYAREHLPPSLDADRKRDVLARIDELLSEARPKVAEVALALKPVNASLTVDGRARSNPAVPDKLWLEPGEHRIEVRADGYVPVTRTLEAKGGASERLEVALRRETAPTPDDSTDDPNLAIILTGAALGAAGIATGIGLVVAAEGKANDRTAIAQSLGSASNACGPGTTRTAECQQIEDLSAQENTFRNVGITTLAVGGAIGIATLLYAVWPRESEESAAQVIPWLAPGHAMVTVRGSF